MTQRGTAATKGDTDFTDFHGANPRQSVESVSQEFAQPGKTFTNSSTDDVDETRLRQETTMTLKWIAVRLGMGAWTHLNRRLYEQRQVEGRTPS